jgi:hypothetical protein
MDAVLVVSCTRRQDGKFLVTFWKAGEKKHAISDGEVRAGRTIRVDGQRVVTGATP